MLIFQTGHGFPAGIPAYELQFHGQFTLRPTAGPPQFAHLRSNYIQMSDTLFDGVRLTTALTPNVSFTYHKQFMLALR